MPSFYTNIVVTYLTPLHDYDDDNEMLNRCRQLSRRSFEVPAEENPPRDLELQFTLPPPLHHEPRILARIPWLKVIQLYEIQEYSSRSSDSLRDKYKYPNPRKAVKTFALEINGSQRIPRRVRSARLSKRSGPI